LFSINDLDRSLKGVRNRVYTQSKENMLRIVCGILAVSFFVSPAFADTFRCGQKLVREGDTKAEVLIRCGEPLTKDASRTLVGVNKVTTTDKLPVGNIGITETTREATRAEYADVETWTYNAGTGKFLRILTFVGGRLSKVETGDRVTTKLP
jgi:Protein of unknown function (DUF2845)